MDKVRIFKQYNYEKESVLYEIKGQKGRVSLENFLDIASSEGITNIRVVNSDGEEITNKTMARALRLTQREDTNKPVDLNKYKPFKKAVTAIESSEELSKVLTKKIAAFPSIILNKPSQARKMGAVELFTYRGTTYISAIGGLSQLILSIKV